jgi:hypothetical protein
LRPYWIIAAAIIAAAALIALSVKSAMVEQTRMQIEAQVSAEATVTARLEGTATVYANATAQTMVAERAVQKDWEHFLDYAPKLIDGLEHSKSDVEIMATFGWVVHSGTLTGAVRQDTLNNLIKRVEQGEEMPYLATAKSIVVPPEAAAFKGAVISAMGSNSLVASVVATVGTTPGPSPRLISYFDEKAKQPLGVDRVLPQLLALCSRLQATDRDCLARVRWERFTT